MSEQVSAFDLGHQGDVDRTQIARFLRMPPAARLRHHEGWRGILKKRGRVPEFFERIITALNHADVEYVIVGMMAGVLQGASAVTRDLDICYRRTAENIGRLVSALRDMNPRPRGFPADLPFTFDERTIQLGCNFTLEIGTEDLDLIGEMSGVGGYERVISEAPAIEIGESTVRVLSLRHLIETKTAAGRPKDLAVLPMLRATLEMHDSG